MKLFSTITVAAVAVIAALTDALPQYYGNQFGGAIPGGFYQTGPTNWAPIGGQHPGRSGITAIPGGFYQSGPNSWAPISGYYPRRSGVVARKQPPQHGAPVGSPAPPSSSTAGTGYMGGNLYVGGVQVQGGSPNAGAHNSMASAQAAANAAAAQCGGDMNKVYNLEFYGCCDCQNADFGQ